MTRGSRTFLAALVIQATACLPLVVAPPAATATSQATGPGTRHAASHTTSQARRASYQRATTLPGGGTSVFGRKRFLTAFYGTAGTSSLGVGSSTTRTSRECARERYAACGTSASSPSSDAADDRGAGRGARRGAVA